MTFYLFEIIKIKRKIEKEFLIHSRQNCVIHSLGQVASIFAAFLFEKYTCRQNWHVHPTSFGTSTPVYDVILRTTVKLSSWFAEVVINNLDWNYEGMMKVAWEKV